MATSTPGSLFLHLTGCLTGQRVYRLHARCLRAVGVERAAVTVVASAFDTMILVHLPPHLQLQS